jgi:SAM-dependent methyltransferase
MFVGAAVEEGQALTAAWRADDEANRSFFDDRAHRYGIDFRASDWASRDSQHLRFAVLAAVDNLEGRRILDVGCGSGEFLSWLRARRVDVDYTGIDIASVMIAQARERFAEATFVEGSVLDLAAFFAAPFDHVFASGLFTRRRTEARNFVANAVSAMFSLCRLSTSFNCLSTWAPRQESAEFHLDPTDALAIAHLMTPRVTLRHDYHRADLTIHLYRERGTA